jgi:hypothetical protein
MARFQQRVPWRELAAHVYPLEKAGLALRDIEAQRCPKAVLKPGAKA